MHLFRARAACFLSIVIFLLAATGADAHVTRVEILSHTDVLDGRAFDWLAPTKKSLAAFISR